jgi:hypothetical protein
MLRVLRSATYKGTKNANATGTSSTVVGNARAGESHGAVLASTASQNANSKSKRKGSGATAEVKRPKRKIRSGPVSSSNARAAESHGAVPASSASLNANSKSKRKGSGATAEVKRLNRKIRSSPARISGQGVPSKKDIVPTTEPHGGTEEVSFGSATMLCFLPWSYDS